MYLLFDIGGTNLRAAASRDGETVGDTFVVPTPIDDFEAGMRVARETGEKLAAGEKIKALALGIAGPLDAAKSKLVNAPNIPGWIGKPLKDELERMFECPAFVENDVALAGLGEAVAGAGKGYGILGYVSVGTGVGGVRIVDGVIDRNRFGFEIGHQVIDASGGLCPSCGVSGDLESYIGGRALERRTGKPAQKNINPEIWEDEARHLAIGLYNTILHWSPDAIVLGSSMVVGIPGISLERIEVHLRERMTIFSELPVIKKAALGDRGGLRGGLELIRQRMMEVRLRP